MTFERDCDNHTEASDVMKLGSALSDPISPAPAEPGCGVPYIALPDGFAVADLERLFPAPNRPRGKTELLDLVSFITFVSANGTDNTRVYGQIDPPHFKAVFNDSMKGSPGWGDHVAVYACPLSREWSTWLSNNGESNAKAQTKFAAFIEDNALDIISPDPATMIEVARTLEAKKKVNFASGIRLDNGQTQLVYEEDIQGTTSKGQLEIPQEFKLALSVLRGGPKYELTARLRYRIPENRGGALVMWFDLLRPHLVIEDAVNEVVKQIGDQLGAPVFMGKPSAIEVD